MPRRPVVLVLLSAAAAALSGCVSCDDSRDVDLTRDLVPGDLAHYQEKAQGVGSGQIAECNVGLPFLFLPVIGSYEDVTADAVKGGPPHLHFEHTRHVAVLVANSKRVSDYDGDGTQLSTRKKWSFLLWALNGESGERVVADGRHATSSSTNVLWGVLWSSWTDDDKSGGRFLLLPWGDERR